MRIICSISGHSWKVVSTTDSSEVRDPSGLEPLSHEVSSVVVRKVTITLQCVHCGERRQETR
mgnify:FL=1